VVSGSAFVGGLVGVNAGNGSISNVYATGSVDGISTLGGLVGFNGSFASITNAYATTEVNGSGSVIGGLVGQNDGTITNTYATGLVNKGLTADVTIGGLIGVTTSLNVINSFWDIDTTGQADLFDGRGTGVLTTDALSQGNYTGWDFINTWWMSDSNTRPFLRSEYSTTITNAHQLQLMGLNLNANYTLANNIDLTPELKPVNAEYPGMWSSKGFVSIGDFSTAFTGSFDGAGYIITGLMMNRPLESNVALFGNVTGGSLSNIGLLATNITGQTYVGALLGYSFNASINNAYSTGVVSGDSYVGGLIGYGSKSINNVYSASTVTGTGSNIGGLAGANVGNINNAYAIGAVSGLSGSDIVGGLVGFNNGNINNAYASGNVSGTTNVGGLIGSSFSGSMTNAFWDIDTTRQLSSAGSEIGKTTIELMTQSTYTGWDFGNTWWMPDILNGYNTRPFLRIEYGTTITNTHQLQMMGMALSASYTLANNLDLTSELANPSAMWSSLGFVPVGHGTAHFTGDLDGLSHSITGLTVNRPLASNLGLFGIANALVILV